MARVSESLKLSESEIDRLMLSESRLGIATVGPGSEINLTPMTFGWANGLVHIFARGQRVANLRRNPTTTILIDTGGSWRELQGVMIRDQAKILENEQYELADEWLVEAQMNLGQKHRLMKNGESQPYAASASGKQWSRRVRKRNCTVVERKGAKTAVIDRGVHGSSMLVDQRTGHEMTNARRLVMSWLKKTNQN